MEKQEGVEPEVMHGAYRPTRTCVPEDSKDPSHNNLLSSVSPKLRMTGAEDAMKRERAAAKTNFPSSP